MILLLFLLVPVSDARDTCFGSTTHKGPFSQALTDLGDLEVSPALKADGVIEYRRIQVEGEPLVIGVQKHLLLAASFDTAKKVLEGFEHYPGFQPGVLETTLTEDGVSDGPCRFFEVEWVRQAPLPLLPRPKYKLRYAKVSTETTFTIQHHLVQSKNLAFSDGFIGLKKVDDTHVLFHVADIFKAHWGLLGNVAPERIWHDSLLGGFKGDWAFKLHVEEPDLDKDAITLRVKKMMDSESHYTRILQPLWMKRAETGK